MSRLTSETANEVPQFEMLEMYRLMLTIIRFEEAVVSLHRRALIPGPVHLSIGQEAEIVGACRALRTDDYMTGNHRSHGHPIAKGSKAAPLMAELMGKVTGVCKGKGGSMHLADFSVGSLGESGIVGSALPVAAGAGLSAQLRGSDQVCLAFFGDGAINTGAFYESLNLASAWKLPVIYLSENNLYSVSTPTAEVSGGTNLADRARAFDIPGLQVDGQDCVKVYKAVSDAVDRARTGGGPTLIEALTYRYREHAEMGQLRFRQYRSDAEIALWKERDPLYIHRMSLSKEVSEAELAEIDAEISSLIEAAVEFAKVSEYPSAEDAFEDLYSAPLEATKRF